MDDLDYDDILAEHRVPIEHRAEPVARATRRILERGLGVTASRLVYEVMEDRLAVARAAVNSLTIGRDEARAEVAALVEHRENLRKGVDAATKQLVSDRSKVEQERDAALDEVERLKAHIAAQTWDADCDRLEGLEAENKRLRDMTDALAGGQASVEDLLVDDVTRARLARLEADVVSLTQAGDLHRKEGDEARAHLCELFPLAKAWSSRDKARIDEARVYLEAIDREGPRAPSVLGEIRQERARQDAKWGPQDHPDIGECSPRARFRHHMLAPPRSYRRALDLGPATWALILLEEVAEAVDAIGDVTALRAELVQVAAVATAWAEAIDRRHGGDRG